MKDDPAQIAPMFARRGRSFGKLARYAARHAQDVERFATMLLEKICQFIARRKEAVSERTDRGKLQQARVQPASKGISSRRHVAIDVVGEAVASRILESLMRQVTLA